MGAALGVGAAFAAIPAIYSGGTQVDIDGANDVPGQVDMTEMGRATSLNPDVRIFWSWDSTSAWTGTGQTGDACALFDTNDTDANINYVVCARVHNTNANPNLVEILPASVDHPVYLFNCSNKKNDRCTNPVAATYTAGQVVAGPLGGTLTAGGGGNLISATDPFSTGESYPNDSAIDVQVASALVPAGVTLVNVCSYPSAGNGGNNNPFDCILTPGVQYGTLVVDKTLTNDNGGQATVASFSFTVGSGTATTGTVASTAFTPTSATTGSNSIQLPVGTYSVAEVGTPITGYSTSYSNCTSVSVTAGGTATCTITNNDNIATPSISTSMSWTLNDSSSLSGFVSGGSASTVTFSLYKDATGVTSCDPSTLVGSSETVTVNDTDGTAATTTGHVVTVSGTYHWIASFSGNDRNAAIATHCADEVTTLP
jgi:hypothetical protein